MSTDDATIIFSHLADNAARHQARTLRIRAYRSADMVSVAVTNDGEPIADNNRDKIFMPFFTTSSLSDWGLISVCQQFCCGMSG
jgi:signal transduction histidine kinase